MYGLSKEQGNLIKALQMTQQSEGFVSDEAITAVADFFGLPAVDVEGVVSFYAQFKRQKPGRYVIAVCDGTACHIKGASLVSQWLSDEIGLKSGQTDEEGIFSMETVACLGCCSLAPVISVNAKVFGNLTRKSLIRILKQYRKEAMA